MRTESLRRARVVPWQLLLELALLVPTLALLWWGGSYLLSLQASPFPHDGLEGTLLQEAGLIRAGEPLYQPLERYRFISAPYPPVHAVVLAVADLFVGPHVFWSGRLISLVSALLTALLIALLVVRVGRSWGAGALAGALFLSAPPTILWATRIKPDVLALLFIALGLYLATLGQAAPVGQRPPRSLRHPDARLVQALLAAAACFTLAFYTKQTAVMAPLAVGLALLLGDLFAARANQRVGFVGRLPLRWPTFLFGLSYLAMALGTWLVLDLLTWGQYTYHVWEMHRGEGWKAQIAEKYMTLLPPYLPLLLLALPLLWWLRARPLVRVPLCYALTAPISLLGTGAVGANHNHLLESLLAYTIAAGVAVGLVVSARPLRPLPLAAVALLIGLQWNNAFDPPAWYRAELEPGNRPERYLRFIQSTPGEILADDISLLYAAGKPIRYNDPAAMGPLAVSGHWDDSGMVDDIANQRFSAIMIPVNVEKETEDHAYRWSPAVIAAVREHYQLLYRDGINTYVPKPRP
jgi:hypothetical protein